MRLCFLFQYIYIYILEIFQNKVLAAPQLERIA